MFNLNSALENTSASLQLPSDTNSFGRLARLSHFDPQVFSLVLPFLGSDAVSTARLIESQRVEIVSGGQSGRSGRLDECRAIGSLVQHSIKELQIMPDNCSLSSLYEESLERILQELNYRESRQDALLMTDKSSDLIESLIFLLKGKKFLLLFQRAVRRSLFQVTCLSELASYKVLVRLISHGDEALLLNLIRSGIISRLDEQSTIGILRKIIESILLRGRQRVSVNLAEEVFLALIDNSLCSQMKNVGPYGVLLESAFEAGGKLLEYIINPQGRSSALLPIDFVYSSFQFSSDSAFKSGILISIFSSGNIKEFSGFIKTLYPNRTHEFTLLEEDALRVFHSVSDRVSRIPIEDTLTMDCLQEILSFLNSRGYFSSLTEEQKKECFLLCFSNDFRTSSASLASSPSASQEEGALESFENRLQAPPAEPGCAKCVIS